MDNLKLVLPSRLTWIPRMLTLGLALFISLFALDVFQSNLSMSRMAVALAIHLIPTGLVLLALVVAWRWPLAGAALFLALGAYYVRKAMGPPSHPTRIIALGGPLFLIGLLFLASGLLRRRLPAS